MPPEDGGGIRPVARSAKRTGYAGRPNRNPGRADSGPANYLAPGFLKVLLTSTSTLAWGAWHWTQFQRPM